LADKTIRVVLEALVSGYKAKMAEATATTKAFSGTLLTSAQQNSTAFTSLGLVAVGIAAGIGLALKSAADAAIAFESSFAGIRKTVDATEPEFAALAQGMRDLAKEIPVNVNELNRIGEAAGQLGIKKEAILGFTRTVADLGATTNLASDDAANALARISNIMGTSQSEFDRLGSTIVALGNAGASTEAEIVEFGLRMAGAGKIAGLTTADILAIGNAMSSVGVEAEAGGTAVQKVLIAITSAVAMGTPAVEKFAEAAGMSADEFAAAWRADPAEAFTRFVEGLGLQGDQAIATLDALGLTDQRLIRSFLSLSNAGDLLRSSIDLGSRAWEENNALTTEAEKRYETTASQIEIAKNRINDAAISFGQLMLPAISAVMGAFGDLADIVGGLPGPVKAAAIAVGVLATGLLLLAGGTLLVLPRLAAVKTAMASMGIEGGILRGSLSLAAKAFNPFTLAIAAATAGVMIWANAQAEARQRVEDLTGAIEADSGALGENTRAKLANTLQDKGILDDAKTLGLSMDTVTDAALGQADAMRTVNAAIDGVAAAHGTNRDAMIASLFGYDDETTAAINLANKLPVLTSEVEAAQGAAENKAAAMGEDATATEGAGDAAAGATPSVNDLGTAMEETASLADQLTEALEGLAGTAIDVEKAHLDWLDSLKALNPELTHLTDKEGELTGELRHGVRTLNERTVAGREARGAILDAVDAAIEHGAAVAEETGSLNKGARAVAEHIRELEAQAVRAGISEKAIHDYIGELNLTPAQIRTAIKLLGIETAKSQIDGLGNSIAQLPSQKTIEINVHRGFHAGGLVMHSGGLAPDEVPAILQRGEFVMSRRATKRLGTGVLSMLNRMHEGGGIGGISLVSTESLDRQFTKLEAALDRASDEIERAVEKGFEGAKTTARDLDQKIAERQRHFDRQLEEANGNLKEIRDRIREFRDTIRSGFASPGDLVGSLTSAISNAPEGFPTAGLPSLLQGSLNAQAATAKEFASLLRSLSGLGLSGRFLAEIASKGPEAIPLMQAIVAGGSDLVRVFNETQRSIDTLAKETANSIAKADFGGALREATNKVARLQEDMADVLRKLTRELERFLETVSATAGGNSSGPRRMHGGGRVGLRGDEVPIIAQIGEGILSRAAMSSLAAAPSGSASPSLSLPSGDVYLQIEGQTFARISRAELLKLKGSRVSLGLS
jgi:TP901 family phage tail tape measure protein